MIYPAQSKQKLVLDRKDYYSRIYVLLEMVKLLKYKYLSVRKTNKEGRGILTRYYLGYSVDLLKQSLERLGVLRDNTIKLYADLGYWRDDKGNTPLFNFSSIQRKKDKERFNEEFYKYLVGFDFAIDLDSEKDIMVAWRDAKKIKELFDEYKLPYSCKFSVTGDTKILIKSNNSISLKSIKDVINLKKKGEKIEVLSLDKGYNIKFSEIYDYLEHIDKTYLLYHSLSKSPIKVTKYHSIYSIEDNEIKEKRVSELKVGDYAITFNTQNNKEDYLEELEFTYFKKVRRNVHRIREKLRLDYNIIRLIGYYLGDGHISSFNNVGFSFNATEKEFIEDVSNILKKLTKTDYFVNESKKIEIMKKSGKSRKDIIKSTELSESFVENTIYNNKKPILKNVCFHYNYPNKGTVQINFNSLKWWHFFNFFCGRGSKNKRLPEFVWRLSKRQVLHLLRGYINSDGYKKSKYEYVFKSVSRDMIIQWCWLLKMNGISCTISQEKSRKHKMPQGNMFKGSFVYILSIPKQELNERELNKFSHVSEDRLIPTKYLKYIYNQCKPKRFKEHRKEQMTIKKALANRHRIINVLNWFDKYKSTDFDKKSKKYINNYKKLVKSNIGIVKIKKIIENKPREVYDISVKYCENFFGGEYPILLHNSGSRGFHFLIEDKYFSNKMRPRNKVLLFGRIAKVIMNACGLKSHNEGGTFDDSIYDDRRIFKMPYSLQNKDDKEFVCLPLSDEQFNKFRLQDMELLNVMKNIKISNRGILTRDYGLKEKELKRNVTLFLKEMT